MLCVSDYGRRVTVLSITITMIFTVLFNPVESMTVRGMVNGPRYGMHHGRTSHVWTSARVYKYNGGFIRRPRIKQERNQSKWRSVLGTRVLQKDEKEFLKAMEMAESAVQSQMKMLFSHLKNSKVRP